jgi:diguanylate cyclase (GGDEF)-like protein
MIVGLIAWAFAASASGHGGRGFPPQGGPQQAGYGHSGWQGAGQGQGPGALGQGAPSAQGQGGPGGPGQGGPGNGNGYGHGRGGYGPGGFGNASGPSTGNAAQAGASPAAASAPGLGNVAGVPPGAGFGRGHGHGRGRGATQVPTIQSGAATATATASPAAATGRPAVGTSSTGTSGSASSTGSGATGVSSTEPTPTPTSTPVSTSTPAAGSAPTSTPAAPATPTGRSHPTVTPPTGKGIVAARGTGPRATGVGSSAVSPSGLLGLTGTAGAGTGATGATGVGRGAPALTAGLAASGAAGTGARTGRGATGTETGPVHGKPQITIPGFTPAATVIERFVNVIPTAVWVALGLALLLAVTAAGAALWFGRRARASAREIGAVSAVALTDPLTGVLNRRGFTDAAEREFERARRYQHPLALAFVDVRGLKAVNDSQGHVAGDQLLRKVAAVLKESARAHDLVGRMGGDELAVVLAEQSVEGADAMSRRVRAQIPVHRAELGFDAPWDVTIGTATYPEDGDTFNDLLQVADRRLYQQRGIDVPGNN